MASAAFVDHTTAACGDTMHFDLDSTAVPGHG